MAIMAHYQRSLSLSLSLFSRARSLSLLSRARSLSLLSVSRVDTTLRNCQKLPQKVVHYCDHKLAADPPAGPALVRECLLRAGARLLACAHQSHAWATRLHYLDTGGEAHRSAAEQSCHFVGVAGPWARSTWLLSPQRTVDARLQWPALR